MTIVTPVLVLVLVLALTQLRVDLDAHELGGLKVLGHGPHGHAHLGVVDELGQGQHQNQHQNRRHDGHVFMVAGLMMVYLTASLPLAASIPLVLVLTVLLGFIIERAAYKPLREAPRMSVMISAIGVSYLLQWCTQWRSGRTVRPGTRRRAEWKWRIRDTAYIKTADNAAGAWTLETVQTAK